ncbi:MAG: glycosyltransferase family 39 protein [Bacteroidia bacterium]|nr:glycosyltransferase family 39 protein [Bacteroidia bacterium]
MNKQNIPFWILTVSVLIILIVPALIQDGMFMDGLQYACVSKNLANGLGSFWHPFLSATWWKNGLNFFLEHPPLVYGIQSLFYKISGNSIYVERLYSFFTAVVTAFLIILNWRGIFTDNLKLRNLAWLPMLLWIIIPVCFWSYQNNMQENTMGIFTLLSVYFIFKALRITPYTYIFLLLSGISVFLASLSKGLPGLFPLAVIILYGIVFRNISFRRMFFYSIVLLLIPLILYALLMLNHEAYDSLIYYFRHRLLFRIREEPTVSNRFFILVTLVTELLPVLIISTVFLIYSRIKTYLSELGKEYKNRIIIFFLIGLAGSLPLMLTYVQSGFYLVPALPFFATGFALLIAPTLSGLVYRIKINTRFFLIFKIFSFLILIICIVYSGLQTCKTRKDHDLLNDVYLIGKIVPKDSMVKAEQSTYQNWSLQFYLQRHFNISVDQLQQSCHKYYLKEKNKNILPSLKYKEIPLKTKIYDLYELQ